MFQSVRILCGFEQEVLFERIHDFIGQCEFCQYCGRYRVVDVAKRSVITLKKLKLTEFQVQVGDYISLFPGNAFCKM